MSDSILILHGWAGSSKSWSKTKEILENQGFKVFVPDLPGFGVEKEPPFPWSISDYVDWVKKYCEKISQINGEFIEPFFLLGHSFGGRIAIKFAMKYPEKLKGLILVASAGITPRPKMKITFFTFISKVGNLIFSLPILEIFREPIRKLVYILTNARDYYFLQGKVMKETFKKTIEENLTPYLSQIKMPTLIIWGDKDAMVPISDAYKMNKEISNSTLKIIPGGKHALNYQFPQKLAEIISNFLKS
jgi:pimeloyl-ACP methyl ester carboxylesterase